MGISDTIPPWAQIKRPTYSPGPFTYGNYVERAAATIYSTNARFYPLNPSLEEECSRLFSSSIYNKVPPTPAVKQVEDVWADFRRNGKDYEYCPDDDTPPVVLSKKKNKKPLATECVFCKNNGEDVKIYKTHILKDADGRILCPILRKYTCPICGEKGDQAHTIKYCPANKFPHVMLASMNCLKNLRNSTGRRRSK